MKIEGFGKIYSDTKIKEINISATLDPNNKLDMILYMLICAQLKLDEKDINGYELRLEEAKEKLEKI